ncbi:hypothetical protein [Glaciecola petra]|uniref:Uncharacterized protein n=1 Tax=Glaciecola petra TaxID=3075602 RepID=A0ABU2ZWZ3_9ALTE|nr:hypothetical protein [Aestuariibacter sp. P117]MDT0596104.1 hypothetical protein [Aestuariibacter sp. P117]
MFDIEFRLIDSLLFVLMYFVISGNVKRAQLLQEIIKLNAKLPQTYHSQEKFEYLRQDIKDISVTLNEIETCSKESLSYTIKMSDYMANKKNEL